MLFAAKYCCFDKAVCASLLLWWSKLSQFFCCSGHFQQIAPSGTAKKLALEMLITWLAWKKTNSCWKMT
jgi:hypothetical protein